MVLAEAALTTGSGGLGGLLLGVFLLLIFQHTLWRHLETLEVPLAWPSAVAIGLAALGCLAVAVAVGPLGAMLPACASAGTIHITWRGEARCDAPGP